MTKYEQGLHRDRSNADITGCRIVSPNRTVGLQEEFNLLVQVTWENFSNRTLDDIPIVIWFESEVLGAMAGPTVPPGVSRSATFRFSNLGPIANMGHSGEGEINVNVQIPGGHFFRCGTVRFAPGGGGNGGLFDLSTNQTLVGAGAALAIGGVAARSIKGGGKNGQNNR